MLDAITASQVAMLQDQLRLQSISQNVSNMQTPGYKRELLDVGSFDDQIQAQMATVSQQMHLSTQHTQGVLSASENPAELALTGDGYFEVQTDEGVFYTRRGDFHVNSQGELVTASNARLLGKSGPIHVDDNSYKIDSSGNLIIDNQKTDQLKIVSFEHPDQLSYQGEGLYYSTEAPLSAGIETRVIQGSLEQSNVKSIDEMMDMVKTSRHFEAAQRVMRTADNLMSTAINQLGEGNV
ncbi:flagellar hook-basal body protein [Legionella sp. CNM-4043-24]|uniref:flagellar hook-basal body protein n=1 Tax=Legionella sp. CNM-4043-24 TaxID=3421646 RepID=UPI00403ACB44